MGDFNIHLAEVTEEVHSLGVARMFPLMLLNSNEVLFLFGVKKHA